MSDVRVPASAGLARRPRLVGKVILSHGTEEQKQQWLPGIATGEILPGTGPGRRRGVGPPGPGRRVRAPRLRAGRRRAVVPADHPCPNNRLSPMGRS
ncbi:acyl-CoA dehydrogenase family protein [Streptomyces sp. NBC_00009]|uniref:acyl-CoA dehydrogenase family protein n=1 Tax=Streptomyces sp. NBC_00009 TaxID=2975620 RepID=UPI00386BF395